LVSKKLVLKNEQGRYYYQREVSQVHGIKSKFGSSWIRFWLKNMYRGVELRRIVDFLSCFKKTAKKSKRSQKSDQNHPNVGRLSQIRWR
jgi:hypothetical protein